MEHTSLLEQVDIFADLGPEQLARIAHICSKRRYTKGEIIFEENSSSDELYIILRGEVEILVDPSTVLAPDEQPQELRVVTRLRRGQSFGEVALVDGGIRSASARCATSVCQVLVIKRNDVLKLCQEDYEMGFLLMRNLAADLALKIRQTDLLVRQGLVWQQHQ
ncbi:MAG: cyclic nucleotide-binding protein [Herpetosiphonaceae bacterium]|nr:MAG: cyclic nucleotide-binding protein [Herpetosiphonaceae bacterium]